MEYDDNSTVLSVILQKKKIEWRDEITANMNVSLGDNDNIYMSTFVLCESDSVKMSFKILTRTDHPRNWRENIEPHVITYE